MQKVDKDQGNLVDLLEEEITTTEQAIAKAIITLSGTKKRSILTEIDDTEVKLLSALDAADRHFPTKIMRNVINSFRNHRVSLDRKGRGEILKIASAAQEEQSRLEKLRKMLAFGGGR